MKLLTEFSYLSAVKECIDYDEYDDEYDEECHNIQTKTYRIYYDNGNLIVYDPEINNNFISLNGNEIAELYKNNSNLECFNVIIIKDMELFKRILFNECSITDYEENEEMWITLEIIKLNDSDILIECISSESNARSMSMEFDTSNTKYLFNHINETLNEIV